MKTLAAVVTCIDSGPLAEEALHYLRENSDPDITTLILVDNGSYTPLPKYDADIVVRYEENIGANAVFHRLIPKLEELEIDVVAYLHCDFMIREKHWDHILLHHFNEDDKLGLVGFIGSSEIDGLGGRGGGTMSSFIGEKYTTGWGTAASVHGAYVIDINPAAVLDHASMVFPVHILKELPAQEDMHTPGHFYDRVLSCEVLYRNYHVAIVGIDADHFSGGTGLCRVPGEQLGLVNRDALYRKWLKEHNLPADVENPDIEIYKEGERRFLGKWRDELKFIPLRVNPDYSITHLA